MLWAKDIRKIGEGNVEEIEFLLVGRAYKTKNYLGVRVTKTRISEGKRMKKKIMGGVVGSTNESPN